MRKQPNILFIMADQFRADAMSCAGNWARTPNLDHIAGMGVRYSHCVTASPICCPARVSLASGLYPHNTGLWTNKGYTMPTEWPTWMAAIRDAGYRTSLFGKTHLHRHGKDCEGHLRDSEDLLRAYGLDDVDEITGPHAARVTHCRMTDLWEAKGLYQAFKDDITGRWTPSGPVVRPSPLGREYHYDSYVGKTAAAYLQDYDRDQPWFCWVSFAGPHEPWDAPEPYDTMFKPADMPAPPARIQDEAPRPAGSFDENCAKIDNRLADPGEKGISAEHARKLRANYAGNVALIDDRIGNLLDVLDARGELDNTVIAFTSDHGEMNGDHGLVHKSCFLNAAARIPMLIATPEMRGTAVAGTVCESPAELIDLGPTLAERAGARLNYEQFGISMLLDPPGSDGAGKAHPYRQDALCEFDGEVMILTERWKAAINRDGQLYFLVDTQSDPDEQRNVAGLESLRETKDALRLRILERLSQSHKQVPTCGYICA